MRPQLLEVVLDVAGHYLDANDALLDVTGYSLEELRRLPIGALSGAPADVASEVWRGFVTGEIDLPPDRQAELRAKDGTVAPVVFLGLRRRPDGSYLSTMRRRSGVEEGPKVLQYILAEWRAAERELAGLSNESPEWVEAQHRVAELRGLYQEESRRRADPGA